MRASRLLSTVLLLQTRGRLTAQQLADELEVSVRTVYRDIESLSAAGVPVYADRGPAGGYQLVDGYRTKLTGLTPDEAESLFLTGIPDLAAELGLGTVVAAAQLKLLAALPSDLRFRAERVRERFHVDIPGWFKAFERPKRLTEVADAVWNQSPLRVRYERWGPKEVSRTLEPLGLVLKTGVWYLVAASDGEPRTYRVSRIRSLDTLPGSFERPVGFDLGTYWQDWTEQYQKRLYRVEVVVRLSPWARGLLAYHLGPVRARAADETAGAPDERGWVQVVLPVESIRHAVGSLLFFGAEAEVVEPPELRERMAEVGRALVSMYENPVAAPEAGDRSLPHA